MMECLLRYTAHPLDLEGGRKGWELRDEELYHRSAAREGVLGIAYSEAEAVLWASSRNAMEHLAGAIAVADHLNRSPEARR